MTNTPSGKISGLREEIGLEVIPEAIYPLPLTQVRQLSVTGTGVCTQCLSRLG